ncbi:MAG: MarR family transcriptional regulator [Saprospiraceae bacterium]|nr:MarR family transcriptional regulator [Saprospiraceae bacterium]MCB9317686.1 MarR family transcriptional regulator [Lewinellaceae bacterium]
MEREDSPYCQCLYYASNALARIMTRMADEAFATTGLSSSYAFLLMTVNNKPGIQPKEISQKMQLTPSTVTRLIEKMEVRGMLLRQSSGRSTEVYPTSQSLELQPKILQAWQQLYKNYSALLGEEEGISLTASIHEASKKLE